MLPLLALISLILVQVPPEHATIFHWAGVVLSLGFLYFSLKFAGSAIKDSCTPIARGFDYLSSCPVRLERDVLVCGQELSQFGTNKET
jgi:hypothetical protein